MCWYTSSKTYKDSHYNFSNYSSDNVIGHESSTKGFSSSSSVVNGTPHGWHQQKLTALGGVAITTVWRLALYWFWDQGLVGGIEVQICRLQGSITSFGSLLWGFLFCPHGCPPASFCLSSHTRLFEDWHLPISTRCEYWFVIDWYTIQWVVLTWNQIYYHSKKWINK